MSYCVHCGVELDATAEVCPLCGTPVIDPGQPVDRISPKPFPTQRGEVKPVSKKEAALLITVTLASVSVACGILNLFLRTGQVWSLYIIGAAAMLWLWFVPPLLDRKLNLFLRLALNAGAVALYVFLIALANHGFDWYLGLALPIILTGGGLVLFLALVLRGRSILTTVTLLLGTTGVYCLFIEGFIRRYFTGSAALSWSLVVMAVCVAIIVPLVIVRRVPSLREEARRRFHM
ncbi:MAG: DUF6320 domain-containing protein [Clostridiales bacterium]|nr:DUF6320 domain-containing protein [Clostridiales bacterium]